MRNWRIEVMVAMTLAAISNLSSFVWVLPEDNVEVKSNIAGMKKDISKIKQEMKQMNGKMDPTYSIGQRIDDKVMLLGLIL